MKKKKDNIWQQEITVVTDVRKIFLESFIGTLISMFVLALLSLWKLVFFREYLAYFMLMFLWLFVVVYLVFLSTYLTIVVINKKK